MKKALIGLCALALAAGAHAEPRPTNAWVVGKWAVFDLHNPLDDTRTITLALGADSAIERYGKRVSLLVRCASNKTEMFIEWGVYLGRETRVTSRLGAAKAETRNWNSSSDRKSTFYPASPIPLLKAMLEEDRLVAQVTPPLKNPMTVTFDIGELKDAIKPVRETCGW